MIQAAEEAVEHAKSNNLSRQEVIDTENELAVRICFLSLSLPDYVISAGPRAKGCDRCSDSSSA